MPNLEIQLMFVARQNWQSITDEQQCRSVVSTPLLRIVVIRPSGPTTFHSPLPTSLPPRHPHPSTRQTFRCFHESIQTDALVYRLLVKPKQVRLEDELSKKVAKFEKRLSETDPVSGAPRYGESMTAKVESGSLLQYVRPRVVSIDYKACSFFASLQASFWDDLVFCGHLAGHSLPVNILPFQVCVFERQARGSPIHLFWPSST